ncbi:hypothetical protein HanRHA438_Chr00c51g0858971 [Helianthus annuus]|nr:hypothetical protein HanRHA438_Chr16g0779681 [Helianthus annuus]KAJ0953733.1 hypothetical protein HanRHA438_Chr00c51g0858971 [Helianthus annuus]
MFSDYSGWFVKYQLQLDALSGAFPEMISHHRFRYRLEFIDVVKGDEEEDTFLVLKAPEKIITYNVHDNSFKHIFSFTKHSYEGSSMFHRYTKTLSSF